MVRGQRIRSILHDGAVASDQPIVGGVRPRRVCYYVLLFHSERCSVITGYVVFFASVYELIKQRGNSKTRGSCIERYITEELCSYLLWGPQNYVTSGRGRSWRRGRGRRGWGEQGQGGWEWEGAEQETNTGGGEGEVFF